MSEIYRELHTKYIIARRNMKDDTYEYFKGCNAYGRDDNGVIRIKRSQWTPNLNMPLWKSDDINRMWDDVDRTKRYLEGILKYDSEKEYTYYVLELEVKTVTNVTKFISNYDE